MDTEQIEQIIEDMRDHANTHCLLLTAGECESWADTLAEMLELLDLVDGTIINWGREEVDDDSNTL